MKKINKLEDRTKEIVSEEQKAKRLKTKEQSLRTLWNTITQANIHTVGILEETYSSKEYWGGNGCKCPKFDERHEYKHPRNSRTPCKMNSRRLTMRHVIIKISMPKILSSSKREANHHIQRILSKTCSLLIKNLEARRQWVDIFKVLKEKNCQPRILCPAKLSFKSEGESLNDYHQKFHKQQMLERVWREGNPPTLLVGMQIGTVTVENRRGVP